tara:strand:+ start:47 stop:448 length:402 start_codon:yes stop_codon:yes gene_type:complete
MMKHIAIVLALLIALSSQARTETMVLKDKDVFYCVSESGAYSFIHDDWEFTLRKPAKFKFQIKDDQILFGSGGHFADGIMGIDTLDELLLRASGDTIGAGNGTMVFVLFDGRFTWSSASVMMASMMVGTCEQF